MTSIFLLQRMSIEDGLATLTNFTANIISDSLKILLIIANSNIEQIIVCGGGLKKINF